MPDMMNDQNEPRDNDDLDPLHDHADEPLEASAEGSDDTGYDDTGYDAPPTMEPEGWEDEEALEEPSAEMDTSELDVEELPGVARPGAGPLPGRLYIVGTPAGNRLDITLRAVRALGHADLVVTWNGAEAARLLREHNITRKIAEITPENEWEVTRQVLAILQEGGSVALMSEGDAPLTAGGEPLLLREVRAAGVEPAVVPGVSVPVTALLASGFAMGTFEVSPPLPRLPEARRDALETLRSRPHAIALAENPARLRSLLAALAEAMPSRRGALAMNLTTPYEAVARGTMQELFERFGSRRLRGRVTILLDATTPPAYEMPELGAVAMDEPGEERGWRPIRRRPFGEGASGDRGGFDRRQGGDRGGRGGFDRQGGGGGFQKRERSDRGFDRGERRGFTPRDRGDAPEEGGGGERREGGFQRREGGLQRRDERGGGGFQRRDDRGGGGGFKRRDDRGGGGFQRRDDRGGGGGGFQRRDDRGGGGGGFQRRDDRGGGGGGFQRRDDRGGGGGFQRRDDRGGGGGFQRRDDRGGGGGGFQRRDDRGGGGGFQRRDDRGGGGGFQRRDDRGGGGGFQRRDDRGGGGGFQRRDDRGGGGGGFQRRDDRGGGDRAGGERGGERRGGGFGDRRGGFGGGGRGPSRGGSGPRKGPGGKGGFRRG